MSIMWRYAIGSFLIEFYVLVNLALKDVFVISAFRIISSQTKAVHAEFLTLAL